MTNYSVFVSLVMNVPNSGTVGHACHVVVPVYVLLLYLCMCFRRDINHVQQALRSSRDSRSGSVQSCDVGSWLQDVSCVSCDKAFLRKHPVTTHELCIES